VWEVEQLLSIPKLSFRTSSAQTLAVIQCLRELVIQDQIATFCFDTLASYTGHCSGAACFVEQEPNKDIAFLAYYYRVTQGTNHFGCIKDNFFWHFYWTQNSYIKCEGNWLVILWTRQASSDSFVESLVAPGLYGILEFAHKHQTTEQQRDNIKEFLKLSVDFLGMFLFVEFGLKSLAVCKGCNGLYKLSIRSKCSSFLTSSRRLLEKNAAFIILLSFCCCLPQNLDNCGGSSEWLHCKRGRRMVYSPTIQWLLQQAKI